MAKPTVLLDKSYLQSAASSAIRELAATHTLLMPCVLFYEMVSADEPKRSRLLNKFLALGVAVVPLKSLNVLLQIEMRSHRCCGRPSNHVEPVHQHALLAALAPESNQEAWAAETLAEQAEYLQSEVMRYRGIVDEVRRLFPQLTGGSDDARRSFHEIAEEIVATPAQMKTFYDSMASAPRQGALRAPPAEIVDENWVSFRLMQVKLLFAMELTHRLGSRDMPPELGRKAFTELEHDVLDQQYLIQGVLEGSLATEEKKLQRWFRLLRPDGQLHCRPSVGLPA